MKKVLVYYSFIITILMVTFGFLGAKSYPELISAALFAPLGLYFGLSVLPKRGKAVVITKTQPRPEKLARIRPVEAKFEKESDSERRRFIRIIGTAGTSLFLLSIFTKRAQAAFFGSVPGPGTVALKETAGTQIDPAIKHPTDGYKIARLDDSTPAYYGFLNKDHAWFIMREESNGTYKYAKGASEFLSTGWDIRNTTLTYADFDDVF